MTRKPVTTDLSFEERESDSLEELTAGRIAANPELAHLIAAATARRAFLRGFAAVRRKRKMSQGLAARLMGTSQSFISRLERALVDPQHSTEDRYAEVLGLRIERRLVPRE